MKTTLSAIAALALVAAAASAGAQEAGEFYAGGSIGYSQFKDTCHAVSAINCDDTDTAWRGFAGYQFSRHLGVEVGYGQPGEVTSDVGYARETKAFDVAAVFAVPVAQRVDLLFRLGAYRARSNENNGGVTAGTTNSGPIFGAGVGLNLGKLGLRAEWQRYRNVGPSGLSVSEDTIDVFGVSGLARF